MPVGQRPSRPVADGQICMQYNEFYKPGLLLAATIERTRKSYNSERIVVVSTVPCPAAHDMASAVPTRFPSVRTFITRRCVSSRQPIQRGANQRPMACRMLLTGCHSFHLFHPVPHTAFHLSPPPSTATLSVESSVVVAPSRSVVPGINLNGFSSWSFHPTKNVNTDQHLPA